MGIDLSSSKTQWSLIVRAQSDGPQARAALGQLLQRYERAILSTIRYFGHPPDQTPEDIKQEFLTRVIESQAIAVVDRGKGTFRSWLRRAVKNHLCNVWRAWHADKNPARRTDYPDAFEATSGESSEHILDRKFAADTLDYVVEQLRRSAPNAARFEAFRDFLPRITWTLDLVALSPAKASPERVAPVAASLGMTRTAVSVAIHRLRDDFRRCLTAAVADTLDIDLADPDGKAEVERELRLLFRALCDPVSLDVHLQTG
jgi:DNA-directed RNA polymerase specialized sigma24 family protein